MSDAPYSTPNPPSPPMPAPRPAEPSRVAIIDFDMPFGSMVTFMLKWALAAIPAAIIIVIVVAMTGTVLTVLLGGLAAGVQRIGISDASTESNYVTSTSSPLVGLTKAEVQAKIGAPSVDFGGSWIVGNRTVYFDINGRVIRVTEPKP